MTKEQREATLVIIFALLASVAVAAGCTYIRNRFGFEWVIPFGI